MSKESILIASPIHKPMKIVEEFLNSLKRLEHEDVNVSYCFIDDNEDEQSSELIKKFALENDNVKLLEVFNIPLVSDWEKGDHSWSGNKIDKITALKNQIIDYFLKGDYTHIFFIDSDLVLHPRSLKSLLESNKDIVSNIFWTKWQENTDALPQVWLKDFYTLYNAHMLYPKSEQEARKETAEFLASLRVPGVYRVGGLGACTLIRRGVLEAGVNFSPIYNISFWGEDRSFCIRAVAYGFELYVNTFHPAFHIYREQELEALPKWIENNK